MTKDPTSLRVLVLAPTRKDAEISKLLLRQAGLETLNCRSMHELIAEIDKGAGAALVTEELLTSEDIEPLLQIFYNQPSWSEFPLIILMKGEAESSDMTQMLRTFGNVTLLERPAPVRSVVSAVKAAVRGRERQYQIRDLLMSERSARIDAEKAGKMKDEFLAVLSHELRTPLNAILGWLQLLKRDKAVPQKMQEGLDVIDRSARLQAMLISDLLDMSRITSGKIHLELGVVDVNAVVEAAIVSIDPAAQEKSILLEKYLGETTYVQGDFGRLQQILWNLLSNAVKFTPPHGRVVIETGVCNGEVFIRICDSGVGISPEFLPYVFERFRQADSSTARRHGGLGLGLAIVKQLTHLHGGRITVESKGEQLGATFSLFFPSLTAQAAAQRYVRTDSELTFRPADLKGIKVLVVDDDDDSRILVEQFLSKWGAEVKTAPSGSDALKILKEVIYDIVISDIGMPDMNGYDFIKRMRSLNSATRRIPAAALTAFARTEERYQALNAGYNAHLTKPIEESKLVKEVARLTSSVLSNAITGQLS